jgi:hypothetical protein
MKSQIHVWLKTIIVESPLFSNEDAFHVHKTLGLFALISYAWRFIRAGIGFLHRLSSFEEEEDDMGFASHPEWTIPTLCLHLALNLSSFEFRIPNRRIKTDGGRIWPEFRIHSTVFLCRSLAAIAINWYHHQYPTITTIQSGTNNKDDNDENYGNIHSTDHYHYVWNLYIVLGAMAAADLCSYWVGDGHSRSIRDLAAPQAVKYFFSLIQFFATAAILFGLRRSSLYFMQCFVIQITAFLFTLRRKRLVSHGTNVVLYGCLLAFAVGVGVVELGTHCYRTDLITRCPGDPTAIAIVTILACTAALWRMGPWSTSTSRITQVLTNKYVIWTVLFILLQQVLRPVLWTKAMTISMNRWHLTRGRILRVALVELGIVLVHGVNQHLTTKSSSSNNVKKQNP